VTAARLAVAAGIVTLAVAAAANATTLSAVGPAAAYDAVPGLLVLDLVAAATLCAVAVWALARGRRLVGAAGLGLAAACLLADALIGRENDGLVAYALGFAAVPLLLPLLAEAAAAPQVARTALWVSAAAYAVAVCCFYDPFLDLSCRRTCAANPILIAHVPGVADAARNALGVATLAWCALTARRRTALIVLGVALAAPRLAVGVDDPTRPVLRTLHVAAAIGALTVAAAVAHDLLRLPRTRGRLGRLLRDVRLADAWGLERCLREATGGGALRLVYHHPDRPVRIDAIGAPVPDDRLASDKRIDIRRRGLTLATLLHAPQDIAAALGPAAELALDNERLTAARRHDLHMLRVTSTRLVALGDAERQRIERNLHDGAQQRLVAAALALRLAQLRDPAIDVDDALTGLDRVVAEVRAVAQGIHPLVLDTEGLGPALTTLGHEIGTPIDVRLEAVGRLPEAIEITIYAAAQEVLTAGHRTVVDVSAREAAAQASIRTDGWEGRSEFPSLRDRVRALGGELTVTGALHVALRLPLDPDSAGVGVDVASSADTT
jgi:signal transduction histidine kinase